jgi:signal transduction histidine kinase
MSGSQLEPERLRLEDVDVAELVEQVCNTVSRVHEDITIHTAIDRRGSRRALLPSVAFSQAILNLIDNAVESGGNEKPIEVIVRSKGDRIEVAVLDHGPGWPQVVRSHIGEPFVTTKPDGVGLGLYYVHSLSEAVGAEFSLEDRPEGGAMVRISLPTISAVGKVSP